ncbi:MAG: BMP family ABC transporter substrate-binding protein [Desulfobacterales bacterium]|nr:BMP family ABC transporter substrate-binding protein [Desulfobacterales bacterium]
MKNFFLIIFCIFFSLVQICNSEELPIKLKAGFIYVSPVKDGGWSYAHDLGRKFIEQIPGVKTSFIESVAENAYAENVLTYLAKTDHKLIFATSFGHMDSVTKVATQFPNVIFMHCSGYNPAKNIGTYFGRIYEARYLTGIVAGGMTKSNILGYVAAYPIPEVIRGINAFTLGALSVNPKVQVHVIWTKSWYNPFIEKKAALTLLENGADVIAQHQDSPACQIMAQEKGVYSIGYNLDMSAFAPKSHLTAPIWNWGAIYKYIVTQVIDGAWKSEDIWWGMKENVVDIAPLASIVPKELQEKVTSAKEKIIEGSLTVFEGSILDQKGNTRFIQEQKATDQEMRAMNWFVKGVVGIID